jgi:predicted PurR-regulated permease PerM
VDVAASGQGTIVNDLSVEQDRRPVPVRTILATIGLVLATVVLVEIVMISRQVLTWIIVGAFFAVALYPVVGFVQRRIFRGKRRALATLLVFLVVFILLAALITAFVVPLATEGTKFAGQLPQIIADARNGKGPVGGLLDRTNALHWVQTHQSTIQKFASGLTTPAVGVLTGVATTITAVVTIFVLAYLMVLEAPKIVDGFVNLYRPATGERIRRVGADCAKSVTGYISGNLLISIICGLITYLSLLFTGVPFAGLIALFVGVVDLIPLVGATLGGLVAVLAAFIHSVPAGIIVLVVFLIYQQLENHLLQPVIYARTVQLNPLTVIIAILIAAELAGVLGALLAIPVASIIQVVLRDIWDHRRGRLKPEPTVGEDREPAVLPGTPSGAAPMAVPPEADGVPHGVPDGGAAAVPHR